MQGVISTKEVFQSACLLVEDRSVIDLSGGEAAGRISQDGLAAQGQWKNAKTREDRQPRPVAS